MRMANHGLVIYKDNSFEAIRTDINPGVSDKLCRGNGVVLLVVIPNDWIIMFRQGLDYLPIGSCEEEEMIYDAAMAWIGGETPGPYTHRRTIGKKRHA